MKKSRSTPRPVPTDPTALLRVGDVAQLLDCSEQQVRRLTHLKKIPGAFAVTERLWRYDQAAVRNWIAEALAAGSNPASHRQLTAAN